MTQPSTTVDPPSAGIRSSMRKRVKRIFAVLAGLGVVALLLVGVPLLGVHLNQSADSLQNQLNHGVVFCNGQPLSADEYCAADSGGGGDGSAPSVADLNAATEHSIANDHDDALICFVVAGLFWLLPISVIGTTLVRVVRKPK